MSRKHGALSFEDPDYEKPPQIWAQGHVPASSASVNAVLYVNGQRYASDMEPELGIGTITARDNRHVTISFQKGECIRQYSLAAAPLRRIIFKFGDTIRIRSGESFTIETVTESGGVVTYGAIGRDIVEFELSDSIRHTLPLDRLCSGQHDSLREFLLRLRALESRRRIESSPVRGFTGARIDVIAHQLYMCDQIVRRHNRRILLSDEVGLGKTIEACLVMHRLLVCNQAQRVLICVPQSIVHVWFVELLRKFNLVFRIMDTDFFTATATDGKNPFVNDQLVLCDMAFLLNNNEAARLAAESSWDILIVDEAHHLHENSPQFALVNSLVEKSRDVLFLTATPQQNGQQNHFARLKLLDPSRYTGYDAFVNEMENHRDIAVITGKILNNEQLDKTDYARLSGLLGTNNPDVSTPESRKKIVDELLDRFGVGRAMFRNTRQTVGGFPKRIVDLAPLSATPGDTETLHKEQMHILDGCNIGDDAMSYTHDPRFPYFTELLKKYPDDKFLVICRSKETAKSVEKAILRHVNVPIALFHEELSLIQRDRNAAWFSEPDGARILLCSEIGSEGRNFQFCRHLVMWDLPPDCELIEQRIGRVDRIGQTRDIIIHVPYILSTASEVFARWFGDAAGIFASTVPAAQEVFETIDADLLACAKSATPKSKDWKNQLDKIIKESLPQIKEASLRLEAGRDRLLEMHSFRPAEALSIVNKIKALDADTWLESFMIDLLKNNGVFSECIDHRTYKLWSESPLDEVFPALRASRPVITFDRATALVREDMEFVTIDHPAVKSGLDMFLGSDSGNACFAEWQNAKGNGLLLDAVFVVECMAPPHLNAQRFMPPTPMRVLVDHAMRDRSDVFEKIDLESKLVACTQSPIANDENADIAVLVAMQKAAMQFAEVRSRAVVQAAALDVLRIMGSEVDRIVSLSKVNEAISQEDIKAAKDELQNMHDAIKNAAPRLDSVRLILVQGK